MTQQPHQSFSRQGRGQGGGAGPPSNAFRRTYLKTAPLLGRFFYTLFRGLYPNSLLASSNPSRINITM